MTMAHVVYDITGCPELDQLSGDELINAMRQTAHRLGCTPRISLIDPFEPFGHTCVLVLSESHITVFTWPESGLAHVDVQDDAPAGAIHHLRGNVQV